MMPSITLAPSSEDSPALTISSGVNVALTRANLWTARLEMMRRMTVPPVMDSTRGAMLSAIVLTAFAPIASRQSTRM